MCCIVIKIIKNIYYVFKECIFCILCFFNRMLLFLPITQYSLLFYVFIENGYKFLVSLCYFNKFLLKDPFRNLGTDFYV